MIEAISPWLGDLNKVPGLDRAWVGLISLLASVFCGVFIGVERERRDKPAGLRTVVLIALGSTIFTLVSVLIGSSKATADPARLAAQIIPGVGFLGAGAILHQRGGVVGLTTGATIWTVAAVGVTIGSGYVAAGFVFTMVIFLTLTLLHRIEFLLVGRCHYERVHVRYRPEDGKSRFQLGWVLDQGGVRASQVVDRALDDGSRVVIFPCCRRHRSHRAVLRDVADHASALSVSVESELDREYVQRLERSY